MVTSSKGVVGDEHRFAACIDSGNHASCHTRTIAAGRPFRVEAGVEARRTTGRETRRRTLDQSYFAEGGYSFAMSIAITEDHRALGRDGRRLPRQARRPRRRPGPCSKRRPRPARVWKDVAELGWLGLHVPEDHGGSGYGIEELVVVVEELGRAPSRPARSSRR